MKTCLLVLLCYTLFANPALSQINWQHTQGPEGGGYSSILYNDSFVFYSDEYYLYRTADGVQWEQLPYGNLWPMVATSDKLVALQGYNFGNHPNNRRLIVSYDQGTTWLEGTLPPTPTGMFHDMAVCSHGIYVPYGQGGHIFRSQDDGLTWDTIAPPGQYCYDIWAFEDRIYVQWGSRFYRLAANGTDWEVVSPSFPTGDHPFSMYVSGSTRLFASEYALWSSQNNSQSWSKFTIPYHNSADNFVAVGSRIYKRGGASGLLYTDDQGKIWKDSGIPHDHNAADLATINGRLLCSTYNQGVLYLNETTNTLEPAYQGLFSATIYNLTASADQLWAACGNGVFAYNLTDAVWENKALLPLPVLYYNKVVVSPSGVIATKEAYSGNLVLLSKNAGNSWDTLLPTADPYVDIKNLYWLGETLVLKGYFGPNVRTADYGATWIQGLMPQTVAFFNGKYYGLTYPNKLVSSSNFGTTWDTETAPALKYMIHVLSTPDRLFVYGRDDTGNYRLYMTTNGSQWQHAGDGLPVVNDISQPDEESQPSQMWNIKGRYYFFQSNTGLFVSLDTCKTWLPVESNSLITCADSVFFTGGFGGGVRKAAPPEIFGVASSGNVYMDNNNNGQQDAGEQPMPGIQVTMDEPGAWYPHWFVNTKADGSYTIGSTPGGNDTLRARVFFKYVEQINPPNYVVSTNGANRDFGVHLKQNITDLSVRINAFGRPRPGFDLITQVQVVNSGTMASSGTVSVKLDPLYQFVEATPPPTVVLGDSLVWDIAQMPVF